MANDPHVTSGELMMLYTSYKAPVFRWEKRLLSHLQRPLENELSAKKKCHSTKSKKPRVMKYGTI